MNGGATAEHSYSSLSLYIYLLSADWEPKGISREPKDPPVLNNAKWGMLTIRAVTSITIKPKKRKEQRKEGWRKVCLPAGQKLNESCHCHNYYAKEEGVKKGGQEDMVCLLAGQQVRCTGMGSPQTANVRT